MNYRSDTACPCKTCEKKGCGKAHDTCERYQAFAKERALANARRTEDYKIRNAIIDAHLRIRGKRK